MNLKDDVRVGMRVVVVIERRGGEKEKTNKQVKLALSRST